MNVRIGNLLPLVALLVGLATTSQADAKGRVARPAKKGKVAVIMPSHTQIFTGVKHKAVVTALKTHMLAAQNGTNGSFGAGFQALVVTLPSGGKVETTRTGNYGGTKGDRSQHLLLKGAGEITHMGTTSTHDLGGSAQFATKLKQRIEGNTTNVSINGKKVIDGLKVDSSGISQHTITLPNKGKLTLEFSRVFNGREFGPGGYRMGRRLVIDHQ